MGIAKEKLTEEQRVAIAGSCFTVKRADGHKHELHGLCPWHDESNPSFSYNSDRDVCHCFSCGVGGDLVALWSQKHGYGDRKEGFKAFIKEFNLRDERPKPGPVVRAAPKKAGLAAAWKRMGALPAGWVARLEKARGWSAAVLAERDIRLQTVYQDKRGALRAVERPDRVAIPIKDAKGELRNIRLYRPGGEGPGAKIRSWAKGFGAARIWPAVLPVDGPVILCEGEPDVLCALSQGFAAATQTSKTKYWKDRDLAPFRGRDVFVAYDADEPGQKYGKWAAAAVDKVAKSVRVIQWPDFMMGPDGELAEDHGQDFSDFIVRHGKSREDFEALMASAAVFVAEESRQQTTIDDGSEEATEIPDIPDSIRVLGEDEAGRLLIESKSVHKIYTCSLKDLTYDQILQVGGMVIADRFFRSVKTAKPGQMSFAELKTRLIMAANQKQLGRISWVGQGLHCSETLGRLLLVGGESFGFHKEGKG